MGLTAASREQLERFKPAILGASELQISQSIASNERTDFRDVALGLACEGSYSSFYAPFDWENDHADIVIVGVTPGKQQAVDALLSLRRSLSIGHSDERAAEIAKNGASFKGGMRSLGARLMDHFGLHKLFGLKSTEELFGNQSHRAHYTSALRYPVLKNYGNYSGDRRLLARPLLQKLVDNYLLPELSKRSNAWILPFGPTAASAVEHVVKIGALSENKVLSGILHPGGQQWNRYNVQLELCDHATAASVPGGPEVLRVSGELKSKITEALAFKNRAEVAPA